MAKKNYYSCKKIKSLKCDYNLVLGMRANGKSYNIKEDVLTNCYVNNKTFVYLRRWENETKVNSVSSYFYDAPVEKITGGEWDKVVCRGGRIYFAQTDEDGEEVRSDYIGWYCDLNRAGKYKSSVFDRCEDIIFEEFVTDGIYLANEPNRLQNFVSTVFRNRKGRVWMIGNTISRVCPYFEAWSLEGTLKQKQGTIEVYNYKTDNGVVKVAVERCGVSKGLLEGGGMFFGKAESSIVSGEWEVNDYPKLEKELKEYEMCYEIKVSALSFNFCLQLLSDGEGGRMLYVYPLTRDRYIQREITDKVSSDIFISDCFQDRFKPEIVMSELFKMNKIFYSDNLTGTDFNSILQYLNL